MKDTRGAKSKNSQTHSNSVVFVLQVRLCFISKINFLLSLSLQSKLATMSNDFKQVLEARTQVRPCICNPTH